MESKNFCVRLASPTMIAFSNDMPIPHDNGANHRIGTGSSFPFCGKGKGSLHERDI